MCHGSEHTRMTIAELEPADFPVIRDWIDPNLFRIFHAPIGDDQLQRLLTRHCDGGITDLGLKAVDDAGRTCGLVHVVFDWTNELGHIQQMLVAPGQRRCGIGRALMQHTLAACFQEHKLHRVQLFVWETNEPAVAFYRSQRFHADGLMREATKIGDRFVGWYCMSLLHTEWTRQGLGKESYGSREEQSCERG
jgi:ribosomal protein S18 acetylase RimI-like enzyme